MWDWGELNSAKWVSQNRYILTAKYSINARCDMKIIKASSADEEIDSHVLGEENMFEYPGVVRNMDFINPDEIFYAGMKGGRWTP